MKHSQSRYPPAAAEFVSPAHQTQPGITYNLRVDLDIVAVCHCIVARENVVRSSFPGGSREFIYNDKASLYCIANLDWVVV
jgi:hypothetical protein